MKLKKENPLIKIGRSFNQEVLKGVNLLHECINDCIETNKCDEAKATQVITIEHIGDRIKDQYIEVLYKDKRALPFLVEDRYRLIKYLDVISDTTEDVAYILRIIPFEFYDDIKENLKILNDVFKETVSTLIDMAELMETDFKTAFQKSFNIETLKRKGRDYKYKILEVLYQKDDRSLKVYLISKICIKLFDMILRAEEISDFLRSLIVKYPSK
jgi:predicted phosphate transport protein (TIGR00153 family)